MTDSDILTVLVVPHYAPRPTPLPIPEAAWDETPTRTLTVNTAWVSHLLGVLNALDQPDAWAGTDEEIEAARQQVREIMAQLSRIP